MTMAPLKNGVHRIAAVAACSSFLSELLARAEQVKRVSTIEPALSKVDFSDLSEQVANIFAQYPEAVGANSQGTAAGGDAKSGINKGRQYAVIETAVRDLFRELVATIPIESPDFVKIWNLFDILSLLSEDEECNVALLIWLIEDLLDSQTIPGCQKIFDYLESRRERIIEKNFDGKRFAILRMCNELLRRLSRAEDIAFCGRVFIFLFQSFPLGDKSSVNLRGEFHVENVTTFDEVLPETTGDSTTNKMDIDGENGNASTPLKPLPSDPKKQVAAEKPVDPDALYPVFWSLQQSFSQPKRLFEPDNLNQFKQGLETTIKAFTAIDNSQTDRSSKPTEDPKRGLKRKQPGDDGDASAGVFNPKYLTSRDLFELEISDVSFRRYVLIQALIIMDFLLSLSAGAKAKLPTIPGGNFKVAYPDQVLNEEDTTWVTEMRERIEKHITRGLSQGDGPYFYRVVETILTRDKHWVRWKIDNCPPIELKAVTAEDFVDAKKTLHRMTASRRPRMGQIGSLSLGFLEDSNQDALMDRLKSSERYEMPELHSFQYKISDDQFDIDSAKDNRSKALAVDKKASKSWRALRIASKTKLAQFDRIDNPEKIDSIFQESIEQDVVKDATAAEDMPDDVSPIIITGPQGSGKSTLAKSLIERHPGVFVKVPRHTSRAREEGEKEGDEFHFVTAQNFNIMLDGDQFLEFKNMEGYDVGTNRKAVQAISDAGKIPLLELDPEAVTMATDMGFSARLVSIVVPSIDALRERLKAAGRPDKAIEKAIKAAEQDSQTQHPSDLAITNEDVDASLKALESYIFGAASGHGVANDQESMNNGDKAMTDAPEENGSK